MDEDEPTLVISPKSQEMVVEGLPFSVEIYRLEGQATWTLEVVDPEGTSHVWDDAFASDKDARTEALRALEEKGPLAFMHGENVVPFR